MSQTPLPPPTTNASMSAPATAAYLAKALGGTPGNWLSRLANDRKPSRATRLLMVEPGPGRPRYATTVVDAFIRDEREKNASLGVRPVVSPKRRFTPHISAMKLEHGVDEPFVLLVTAAPLSSYELTVDEARGIARRLLNAADEIETEQSQGHGS